MSQMYNICVALIFAIIVVGQRAEATTNELTTNRKEGSCQNEKSLVNICKHQYTVSEGFAKKLFKTIFNEDSDVHNVGSNCCKQLFHKEGRLCHDTFVSEIIKESPYNKRKSFYIERSANAWKSCVNSTIMSD
ncbi:hypothetical protein ACFE04_004450 [Oxalis oulophora]